jgi:pimeloyl-ACP methyl ester carboxylesterase
MTKHPFKFFFTVCMFIATFYGCTTHEWEPREMNSRAGPSLEVDLKPNSPFCGFVGNCKFDLHYFSGKGNLEDPERHNVLFIPGGPGEIVERSSATFDSLNIGANFFYFDVRGTGYSVIPESNVYDQFLRAEYVVEDIEALRKRVLDGCSTGQISRHAVWMGDSPETKCKPDSPKAWDAIYAHSWGTIVAQMYAWKYPQHVTKLILSAPVSRAHDDTESARREKIVENLIDIYERHGYGECSWSANMASPPSPGVMTSGGEGVLPETNTFCFLKENDRDIIRGELTTLLNNLGHDYGSTAFVDSFYNELKVKQDLTGKYRYPREFFRALRQLEWLGASEKKNMKFDTESKVMQAKFDAAFFIGYYLMLKDKPNPNSPNSRRFSCEIEDADFLWRIDSENVKKHLCKRIDIAEKRLREMRSNNESARARLVFGVSDGLTRWIFEMLAKERRLDGNGCFTGMDVQDVASGHLLGKQTVMREQAKKLEMAKLEKVCPWDPKPFRHDVETLIFTGDADPVTAGGQPEYFFDNGLERGKRVLIKFPGAGHHMQLQVKDDLGPLGDPYSGLLSNFLRRSVDQFIQDKNVLKYKEALGAEISPAKPEKRSNP